MIEQKKKMRLDELQVDSFVTKFDTQESAETNDLKGGITPANVPTFQKVCDEIINAISRAIC
jgi:hypothetical protein